jgi:hypothetical protein
MLDILVMRECTVLLLIDVHFRDGRRLNAVGDAPEMIERRIREPRGGRQ